MSDSDLADPLGLPGPGDPPGRPREHAEAFAAMVEGALVCSLRGGEPIETTAWILAKDPQADHRLSVRLYHAADLGEDAHRLAQLTRLRELTRMESAVGAAYVTAVRFDPMPVTIRDTEAPPPRGPGSDAVLLLVEHRALPRARRRIALPVGPAPVTRLTWVDFDEHDLLVFAGGGPVVPSLLPPIP